MTHDLAAFLTARLDEDERMIRGFVKQAEDDDLIWMGAANVSATGIFMLDRRLTDIDAKRRIIDLHSGVDPCDAHDPITGESEPCETLRLLALPYADHPDYDKAWRPWPNT